MGKNLSDSSTPTAYTKKLSRRSRIMATLQKSKIKYLVVHCSATKGSRNHKFEDVDFWHRKKGWDGCGYHYVIERDGTIKAGRPENKRGAHVRGFNSQSLGICLIGGLGVGNKIQEGIHVAYTQEQELALTQLLDGLHWKYPKAKILGHRDLSPDANGDGRVERSEWLKACPCFDVVPWVEHNLAA
jgi:N-acetylmuramoyl-L-alanine amidase